MEKFFIENPEGDLVAVYVGAIQQYIDNPNEALKRFILELWEKIKP